MLNKVNILNVGITNENEENILEYLLWAINYSSEKYYVVTPNPEIIVYAYSRPHYRKILNEANIALPDGIGLFLASYLFGTRLKERIAGVDFMEEICKRLEKPVTVGFLGGRQGVAKLTADCLKKKYPLINIVFVGEEWSKNEIGESFNSKATINIKKKLSSEKLNGRTNFSIDLLFVAFGFPKQELWIHENLHKLPVKVAMGVGGSFDYISGKVMRAPYLIRAMGFEWLFRLFRQPWRLKRQWALFKFLKLVFEESFKVK